MKTSLMGIRPPDEKDVIQILPKDDGEVLRARKEKLAARVANKNGYRDLVMSTEGICLNIVENVTSDKLSKGDLRKAWGRLERRWNLKTREDKVEVYTKFLNYMLENTRQKPMDWLAFLEMKCTELANTGHKMDDEMFITHLLNSLPQSEYEGAILVIKEKLRKGDVELPEIAQILEDKYQAMRHVKGCDEEEDDYALLTSQSNKKKPKKAFKGCSGYCGEFGHKAADCPNKKSNQNKGQKGKPEHKKKHSIKGDSKGKGHSDMSKIKCFNCGEYGHFAQDCLKARDNANIAQESEQDKKVKNMLDLDNISVCKECVMMCTEVQYEDEAKDIVVHGDQGISTEEYEKATYGKLMKTQSKEEEEVKCNVALCTNDSVSLEKKSRRLNETMPNKNVHDVSQSDISLNEKSTGNTFDNVATVVKGPTGDDDENESRKAWTMEMLMNDGNISMTMTNGSEQASEDYKKFLYTRATHSNHVIQYHMQQIIERQKVVDKYRSMMMEGMSLIPLESNLYKNDPVVISQTIQMIEVDNFWHLKTFEAVLTDLWRRWDEVINEQKDVSMHCTENDEINNELDGKEVIDPCSKIGPQPVNSMTEKKAQKKKSGHNEKQNNRKVGEQK